VDTRFLHEGLQSQAGLFNDVEPYTLTVDGALLEPMRDNAVSRTRDAEFVPLALFEIEAMFSLI